MDLGLNQSLKLTQSLIMTPQLQAAIKLLTLNRAELESAINTELVENPLLEDASDEGGEREKEPLPEKTIDWDAYRASDNFSPINPMGANSFPAAQDYIEHEDSLIEHLEWQVQMSSMNVLERAIAIRLIGELSEDGYLREPQTNLELTTKKCDIQNSSEARSKETTLERLKTLQKTFDNEKIGESFAPHTSNVLAEIAKDLFMPPAWINNVRKRLMKMDPVGCAALNIQECLLAQLEAKGFRSKSTAYQLASHFLSDLKTHNFKKIIKSLGISKEDLTRALNEIESLEPIPGRRFQPKQMATQFVIPDAIVIRNGSAFTILSNDDGLPKLRLSPFYLDQLSNTKESESRKFLKEKANSAAWLIRSIHQRQRTICRVVDAITRLQEDWFLNKGPLRPLILKVVADDLGLHESTISRVTSGKYILTERGICELKYFFSTAISSNSGSDVSSESVKVTIKRLIAKEDSKKPLSDSEVVRRLKMQDIQIARRTVAKYREALGILPSAQRKRCS